MRAYKEWIRLYVLNQRYMAGKCESATKEMVAEFPELRRVAGWVETYGGDRLEHWWLVTEDGHVVDPTVSQFGLPLYKYIPWEKGMPVKVGRCMNCGAVIMREVSSLQECVGCTHFCSEACEEDFDGL